MCNRFKGTGERMSRGQSQRKTGSGRRALERCKAKGKANDAVFLDVDGDNIRNYIIIDPPSLQQTSPGTSISGKDKTALYSDVIYIDGDETSDCDCPQSGLEGGSNHDTHAASSNKTQPASNQSETCIEVDGEEYRILRGRKVSLKSSKCQVTSSRRNSSLKQHGVSMNSPCEKDDSDCDLVEDFLGNIREQWEKASLRKKTSENVSKVQSRAGDKVSASESKSSSQNDVEVANKADQTADSPLPSSPNNADYEKDNMAPSTSTNEGVVGDTSQKFEGENQFPDLGNLVGQERPLLNKTQSWREPHYSPTKASFLNRKEKFPGDGSFTNTNWENNSHINHGGVSFGNEEGQVGQGSDLHFAQELGERCYNHEKPSFGDKMGNISRESNLSGFRSEHGTHFDPSRASNQDEETSFCNTQHTDKFSVDQTNAGSGDKKDGICRETTVCGTWDVNELAPESISNAQLQVAENPLFLIPNAACPSGVQNYIIGEREILKKTDKYKCADEEEWAARQRELQIQAEEARRLRKRKKAETMRLLDMERRQKQRVEEMREAQKKGEEILNLKEQLRVEVRRELGKLEAKCRDMASLLHSLGIHVRGPSSSEVHAAYKQALLRFHPDRASRSDIRPQVEAEEKFKLISSAKEKLMLTL